MYYSSDFDVEKIEYVSAVIPTILWLRQTENRPIKYNNLLYHLTEIQAISLQKFLTKVDKSSNTPPIRLMDIFKLRFEKYLCRPVIQP